MARRNKGGRPQMYDPRHPPILLCVHVPAPVHAQIKYEAAGYGISMAELVRRALVAGLPFLQPPAKKPNGVRQLMR